MLEVNEVSEVSDVCFVRQMVIYVPLGGIVDNFVNSDNCERSDNFRKLNCNNNNLSFFEKYIRQSTFSQANGAKMEFFL